jgi:Zn-dependent protease with chaperone function
MTNDSGGFISPVVTRREHRHRAFLLLGLSTLLLLSVLPTIGHHLFERFDPAIASVQHVGVFCAAALRILLTPVHGAFHIALIIGLAYAVWDRVSAWRSLRSVIDALACETPLRSSPLGIAASRAGLPPDAVRVVSGLPNPAFTAGMFAPRIYVSSLIELQLDQDELDCVIAHEAAHVRRRDPLRLSIYRFLSCVLFWMPALKDLAADMTDEAEIAADNFAGRQNPFALASAILRLAAEPQGATERSVVAFHNPDILDRRIRRLTGESTALPTHLSRRSVFFAALAVALVVFSGLAAAQPSSSTHMSEDEHCRHHHGSLWSHLWCSPVECHGVSAHCHHAG